MIGGAYLGEVLTQHEHAAIEKGEAPGADESAQALAASLAECERELRVGEHVEV